MTAVFYHSDYQKTAAEESKRKLGESGRYSSPVVTDIRAAMEFYPAEGYHQNYYQKNPIGYQNYKHGSGRDSYMQYMKNIK